MVTRNKFLLMLAIFAVVFVSANFVSSLTELVAPFNVSFANYSGTITVSCNSTLNGYNESETYENYSTGYNVSIYYNSSGGSAGADGVEASLLITIWNTTLNQSSFITTVSTVGLPDRLFTYNFTCRADNGIYSEWATTDLMGENITIINTPVGINVTGINGTDLFTGFLLYNVSYTNGTDAKTGVLSRLDMMNDYANVSGNFSIDATVNITVIIVNDSGDLSVADADQFGYLDSVYFNLSLDGVETLFWQMGEPREPYNFTINTLNFDYGNGTGNITLADDSQGYKICIYANDTLGNINNTECYTLTVDNNAPAPSLSQVTADTTTDTITLTISSGESGTGLVGDCTTDKGTVTAQSITHSNLDCGTSYSFTVTCTDFMGFAGTATTSFSTNDCGTSAATGGSGTVTGKTYSATTEQITTGYTKQVATNDQIKFTVGTASHSIKATSIAADKVTITISSNPIIATLSIGDIRNFDINADGTYDVEVKLNSIALNKADLTIKKISTPVTSETEAAEAAKEEAAAGAAEEEAAPASLTWLWIVLVIVVIVIVVYFVMKKRK